MKTLSEPIALGRLKRFALLLGICAAVTLCVALLASLHLTVNRTSSMPLGFYLTVPAERAPRRGDLVEICLPIGLARFAAQRDYMPPGPCAAQIAPLLKHIAGVAGDVIDLHADGVVINGRRLPGSALRVADAAGRRMPHIPFGRRIIAPGYVWLWTPSSRGWDSRYYGALPITGLRAFARPLLVW